MAKIGTVRVGGEDVEYGACENSARPGWGWIKTKDGRYLVITHVPTREEVEKKGNDPSKWDVVQTHNSNWNL